MTKEINEKEHETLAKENIVFSLINAGANAELLRAVPYRRFHDLAVVYKSVINNGSNGISSTTITNDTAEEMNWSEQDLFDTAWKNTRSIFPTKITGLAEACGMPAVEIIDEYVITNTMAWNGAAGILYDDVLRTVAEKIDEDFYLLPCSCHEMLAVPSSTVPAKECLKMVRAINSDKNIISEEVFLSDNIYHYDCGTGVVSMIS